LIKRPLCVVCLAIMMIMLSLEAWGLTTRWRALTYQSLEEEVEAGITCQIEGKVRYYERKPKSLYIYLENSNLTVHFEQYSLKETIIKYSGDQSFAIGNQIKVEGKLEAIPAAGNPGQFDMQKFYRARNIDFFVNSKELRVVNDDYDWLRGKLYQLREAFSDKINLLVPEDSGVLNAMLTGEKSLLDEEVKIRYQMSGIMHIISISGLHFSILGIGCHKILLKLGLNYYMAGIVAVIVMILYGILTGGSISVMRALIMFVLYIGASLVGRTYDMISALALSAILILWEYPSYLYDSGFQLSFAAVLGIGIVYPLLKNDKKRSRAQSKISHLGLYLEEGILSGLAIWLVTLPILLSAYYEVALYGTLLNLLVIPTAGVVLLSGLLGGSGSFLSITLGRILIMPANILLMLYDWLTRVIQQVPYATLILGKPKLWKCVGYYLVLGLCLLFIKKWRSRKEEKIKRWVLLIGVLALNISLMCFLGYRGIRELTITALDVGQGDSLVITTPTRKHYLIDGGSSSVTEVGKYRIIPYLKSQGIQTIEAVLVTHPDIDHLSGLEELFSLVKEKQTSMRVKSCILPSWMKEHKAAIKLIGLAKEAGIELIYVNAKDRLQDGEVVFDFLHPSGNETKQYTDNPNAGSLTFVLDYRDFEGVFTGDLCDDGEVAVTKVIEACEFLKVAHHGSKNSTPMAFLEQVQPKLSVISCDARNAYGHPHPELLERLDDIGSVVYATKDSGAITITTDGQGMIKLHEFIK